MALVVKSWKVTTLPAPGEPNVSIVARDSGLLSFVLSIVGIDATATLQVSQRHVFYEKGSLSGFERRFVPLEHVASTLYGRIKPWKKTGVFVALSIGLGGLLGGVFGVLLAIFGMALSLLYYFLNRTLTIGVSVVSGQQLELSFSRSVLEGQEVNEAAAEKVVRVIEHLIKPIDGAPLGEVNLGSTSGTGVLGSAAPQSISELGRNLGLASRPAPQAPPVVPVAPAATSAAATVAAAKPNGCPKCGAAVDSDELFCGSCGNKLR